MRDKFFQLSEHNTTIRTEAIGGITTFLAMVFIVKFAFLYGATAVRAAKSSRI